MIDHIKNLKEYIQEDFVYNDYINSKNKERYEEKMDYIEKLCISHCEDIKWAIDELEALYELVKEMKNENIKTRKE